MELQIKEIQESGETSYGSRFWKFILVKGENSILLYAGDCTNNIRLDHAHIANSNNINLEDILGGGRLDYSSGLLRIHDTSIKFGPVPNSAMIDFFQKICEELTKRNYDIQSALVGMYRPQCIEQKHIDKWQELGYNFPDYTIEEKIL